MRTREPLLALAASLSLYAVYFALRRWIWPAEDASGINDSSDDEDDEVPDDLPVQYRCPISLGVIYDPVVLCATGHVYDYSTIRAWFSTGNRLCPKSNVEVFDVQVTRLPWLKQEISAWLLARGFEPPPQANNMEAIQRLDPAVSALITKLRSSSGAWREEAIVSLHGALSKVQDRRAVEAQAAEVHRLVVDELLEELVWLMRYGEPKVQGVAAHILLWFDDSDDVQWLAACAIVPVAALCWAPDLTYTAQMATRLLYNLLVPGGTPAKNCALRLGVVECLTRVLGIPRDKYKCSRDRVVETLRVLAESPAVQEHLRDNALSALVEMASQDNNRWERRDASALLLRIGMAQAPGMPFSARELCSWSCCSDAWLARQVDDPVQGFTPAEAMRAAMVARFADKSDEELAELGRTDQLKDLADPAALMVDDTGAQGEGQGEAQGGRGGPREAQEAQGAGAQGGPGEAQGAGEAQGVGAQGVQGAGPGLGAEEEEEGEEEDEGEEGEEEGEGEEGEEEEEAGAEGP